MSPLWMVKAVYSNGAVAYLPDYAGGIESGGGGKGYGGAQGRLAELKWES